MRVDLTITEEKSLFINEIEKDSDQNLGACYQCGKCTAGCPIAEEMDYGPSKVMRFAQFGLESEIFDCDTIWLCASCLTCSVRCPRGIEVADVMDSLRRRAFRAGIKPPGRENRNIRIFVENFLRTVRWFGRIYELGMIGLSNLMSGRPFKNLDMAPKMIFKGKIAYLPHISNYSLIKRVFKLSEELEDR